MAGSRKSRSSDLAACVADAVRAHVPAGARITLGLSGGIDSVVLLDALAGLAGEGRFVLDCLHVHHGLSADADRWAGFCVALGRRYGVPVVVERVHVDTGAGLGIEGAAREARYAAFARRGAGTVALAHHRDDQAETVILQLVRGAGVAGLAAMPAWQPGTPAYLRPLLEVGRAAIEAEALRRGLEWVRDASNEDARHARNLVRQRVIPALGVVNPAAAVNIARSAAHLAEAHALLRSLGEADLAAVSPGGRPRIAELVELGPARARNALRVHLEAAGLAPPSSRRLEELLRQLAEAREDAGLRVALGPLEARRFRGELWLVATPPRPERDFRAPWRGEASWTIRELGGTLSFEPATGDGLDASVAVPGRVEVRVRRGGERLRIGALRPGRTLKHLFQESALPPWERAALPLVYCDGRLACIPGVGIDPQLAAGPAEPGLRVRWSPLRGLKPVIK